MFPDSSTIFYLSYAALWILVILHSLLLLGIVRIVYQLQQTNKAVGKNNRNSGKEAPAFSTVDIFGKPINSLNFAGHTTALLFVSPGCPACTTALKEDMEYLNYKGQGNVIVICSASIEKCTELAGKYGLKVPVVADPDERINRIYEISSVPTIVLLNENNQIQSYGQPHQEDLENVPEKVIVAEI